MLSTAQLETILARARDVSKLFPVSYDGLVGYERMAILHILEEPLQSTLHSILQLKVTPGTKCIFKGCTGTLNKKGKCSEECEQFGINVVHDIMNCLNCDSYGFPCPTCKDVIFHNQIQTYVDY